MPDLNVTVPHQLSQEEALRRIKLSIAQTKVQHGDKITEIQEHWNDNVGTFNITARGFAVPVQIAVNPSDVTVQSTLPFIASLFMGKIEEGVRDLLTRVLQPV